VRLDRYAKFRKLGMFEEHLVHGGQWREARKQRAAVRGPLAPHLLVLHAEHCL
jgi:acetyl-CoA carboxylase carboxyl transferase subunit alpha